jgi:hypothetical protein
MPGGCPFLSAVFFLVLSVYCLLLALRSFSIGGPTAYCFLTFAWGGTILAGGKKVEISRRLRAEICLRIAIRLCFWYSEVNFRGLIHIFIKILWIKLEPIIKKKSSVYLAPKLKDCILPRYWKSEGCMPAIASIEELDIAQRDFRSMFLAVSPHALRFMFYGNIFTPCAMRYAVCRLWLEERAPEQLKGEGG